MSEDDLEQFIAVRLQRQGLLRRRLPKAPMLSSILAESLLIKEIGSRAVMADQLRHLLNLAELRNISIRIMPLSAGAHYGALAGTFMMLNFPTTIRTTPEPPVVYSESLTGALYLDRPDEIALYEKAWASLDQLALDEEQPIHLIDKIVREVHHD